MLMQLLEGLKETIRYCEFKDRHLIALSGELASQVAMDLSLKRLPVFDKRIRKP
jgi:hypothetical protein